MTTFTGIALIDRLLVAATPRVNDRGNEVRSIFHDAERYLFDFQLDSSAWEQLDTTSDAAYFGVWLSKIKLSTLSYVEGDIYFVQCPDAEHYDAELADLCRSLVQSSRRLHAILFLFNSLQRFWFVSVSLKICKWVPIGSRWHVTWRNTVTR